MNIGGYRSVLGNPRARSILVLSVFLRIPVWAAGLALTLHVVGGLGRSYSEAGLATTVMTVGLAISNPWRGRLVDRLGLRRALLPSLIVLPIAWSFAPFVSYPVLLVVAFVGALFTVPSFSVVRQVLINAVPDAERRTALALDSVFVEISFMAGPALGVVAATYGDAGLAVLVFQWLAVAGALVLWLLNPPLLRPSDAGTPHVSVRSWLGPVTLAILAASLTTTLVLTGGDLGSVAALREMGRQSALAWVLAVWGLGSAVGGLAYGAMSRRVSAFVLLGLLGLVSLPVVFASGPYSFGALMFLAGLLCAPTLTATVEHLSRVVPSRAYGEAMGWHGSALTAGSALGAPVVGFAIDRGGWQEGFVVAAAAGILVGVIGQVLVLARRRRFASDREAP